MDEVERERWKAEIEEDMRDMSEEARELYLRVLAHEMGISDRDIFLYRLFKHDQADDGEGGA